MLMTLGSPCLKGSETSSASGRSEVRRFCVRRLAWNTPATLDNMSRCMETWTPCQALAAFYAQEIGHRTTEFSS